MAGVNIARTLAFLMTCPVGLFIWVVPKLEEHFDYMKRHQP